MGFKLDEREEEIARLGERLAAKWACIFIPILTLVFGFLTWNNEMILRDGDYSSYNKHTLILSYVTVAVTCVYIFALAYTWNENEIVAVHHGFTIFYFFFSLMNSVSHIVYILSPASAQPGGSWIVNLWFIGYTFLLCFSMQCTLVGALAMRQRLFYEIFHNHNLTPSFWVAVPLFTVGCLSIAIPHMICGYMDCGPYISRSSQWAQMLVMGSIFAYYLYFTYTKSRLFLQFWQNIRAFVVHNLAQFITLMLYIFQDIHLLLFEVWAGTYFVWFVMLDTWTLPLVRALARKVFNIHLWSHLDWEGVPERISKSRDKLDQILEDKETRLCLEEFANMRFAGENVRFLVHINDFRKNTMYGNKMRTLNGKEAEETQFLIERFVQCTGAECLNLSSDLRDACLLLYRADASFETVFKAVEEEVKFLIAIQLLREFLKSPAYEAIIVRKTEMKTYKTEVMAGLGYIGVLPKNSLAKKSLSKTTSELDDSLNTCTSITLVDCTDKSIINE